MCAMHDETRGATTSPLHRWPAVTAHHAGLPANHDNRKRTSTGGAVGGYNELGLLNAQTAACRGHPWTTRLPCKSLNATCGAAFRIAPRRCTTSATCGNSNASGPSRGAKSPAPTWSPSSSHMRCSAPVVWSWKLTDAQRGGLSTRQFVRYQLMHLGLGQNLTHVVRGGAKRLIAPPEEVLALKPELRAA